MMRATSLRRAVSVVAAGGALALVLALVSPAGPAAAATVPIDLYAKTGTTTLPAGGQSVTVWGYSLTDTAVTRPGGPTLVVNVGDTVDITLHNMVGETSALLVQGQGMVPDRTGVATNGTKVYSFTATRPGTYLYEAGLLPNAQHQVAMGLYGALVVRSATPGQAYGTAATAYDDEAVLVLSEIDPALNNAAAPASFDMRKYAPRYFLVNGEAYPDTDAVSTAVGRTTLLRYVNAGSQYHSMSVLGAHQTVVALDGSPLSFARQYVAETFGPGQTADALVTPTASGTNRSLAVHDGNLLLHNSNTAGTGGMLTFLDVTGTGAVDDSGPATTDARSTADVTATVSDAATGGSVVTAAEYHVDAVTSPGTAMDPVDGTFDSVTEDVVGVGAPALVGQHIVYVRGQDSLGQWGPFSSVLVSGGDAVGPVTTATTVSPDATNGTVAVSVSATADDTASGGSDIAAAELFLDTVGADGTGTSQVVGTAAAVSSIDATIAAGTVNALTEGEHVVSIHAQDSAGNWGEHATASLVVDKTGPTTTAPVSVAVTPNNGTLPYNPSTLAVRIATTVTDPASGGVNTRIARAEGFIDAVGAPGTGFVVAAADGAYTDPTEGVYADIPLATVAALTNGSHVVSVRGRDAAGNWGPVATGTLMVDKVRPVISALTATPNPTQGATTITLTGTSTDTTTLTRAEWFRGTDPGLGLATPMTITGTGPTSTLTTSIDITTWNEGTHTLTVRTRDAAGNWSTPATTTVAVRAPIVLSTLGNTNPPGVAGTPDDADLYTWNGTTYTRTLDATTIGLTTGANIDGYDRIDATHYYLSFATDTTVPGLGTVQDEDVVLNNNGTWSVFFNGTAHGLTAATLDLDAINITGTTLYFSTLGNTNPPGVTGTADDADIYSWNGTTYTRVIDATAIGLPTATNTDGFVRKDATHYLLSFSTTTTTVPTLGTTQDEDILARNTGTWSVYFDGTTHGLTTDTLDIDAFDIP
ncbi:multicopper oxidase domain-containing protein [Cellulomonas sp.]|uniref:multicopper oxidase domain-containing protein n=1 Tax=Cellulomonas sp. TaxID=40001 RepID=UPI003BAD2F03